MTPITYTPLQELGHGPDGAEANLRRTHVGARWCWNVVVDIQPGHYCMASGEAKTQRQAKLAIAHVFAIYARTPKRLPRSVRARRTYDTWSKGLRPTQDKENR